MILTIDIGNMTTLIGGFEGEQLHFTGRCASNLSRTEDEYVLLLRDILGMYGVDAKQVEGSILSSVVPALRTVVCRALERLTGQRVFVVGPGLKNGLNIRIDDPGELGSDMVVNAVAALAKYPKPIAIFDFETATTLSVIGKDVYKRQAQALKGGITGKLRSIAASVVGQNLGQLSINIHN